MPCHAATPTGGGGGMRALLAVAGVPCAPLHAAGPASVACIAFEDELTVPTSHAAADGVNEAAEWVCSAAVGVPTSSGDADGSESFRWGMETLVLARGIEPCECGWVVGASMCVAVRAPLTPTSSAADCSHSGAPARSSSGMDACAPPRSSRSDACEPLTKTVGGGTSASSSVTWLAVWPLELTRDPSARSAPRLSGWFVPGSGLRWLAGRSTLLDAIEAAPSTSPLEYRSAPLVWGGAAPQSACGCVSGMACCMQGGARCRRRNARWICTHAFLATRRRFGIARRASVYLRKGGGGEKG